MKTRAVIGSFLTMLSIGALFGYAAWSSPPSYSEQEAGFASVIEPATDLSIHPRLRGLKNWQRPAGPIRVGLQVGHWQTSNAPEELSGLRGNTGTSGGGQSEVATNLRIAQLTKTKLEALGFVVDLLPVTLPANYWADMFIAIHADGNTNSAVRGFKVAAPRRDYSGQSEALAAQLRTSYQSATRLPVDPNISRNMRGYYAFNWRRYDHSIHPKTMATIIETGFLTNSADRQVLIQSPATVASGIAQGIIAFSKNIKT